MLPGGLEEREPHLPLLFEHDPNREADAHIVWGTTHDVGGQAYPRVLVDGYHGDHVRVRVVGVPSTLRGCVTLDDAPSGHLAHAEVVRSTIPAHRRGRVFQAIAGAAVLELQLA
jgi:hypothetical protein